MKKKQDIFESITDDKLVTFLQLNSPTAPEELIDCEDLIMESILKEKQKYPRNRQYSWLLLPTAILTGILIISTQLFKPNTAPQTASEQDQDIEAFMINTWQGAMAFSE